MTNYRELERIKANPVEVRTLATGLASIADLNDWENGFIGDMRNVREPITTRQAEKLLEIRDSKKRFEKIDGFSVAELIRKCFQNRFDLGEQDESFIAGLEIRRDVTRPEAFRLCRIARELGELERHQGWGI